MFFCFNLVLHLLTKISTLIPGAFILFAGIGAFFYVRNKRISKYFKENSLEDGNDSSEFATDVDVEMDNLKF